MRSIGFLAFVFTAYTVFDSSAGAQSYHYRSLDEKKETDWNIEVTPGKDSDASPEQSLKNLQVKKSQKSLSEAFKKNPSLAHPKTIAIIGDTGCRLKESLTKTSYQDCNDPKAWRYPEVIQSLAKEKPDLIIHVGDYHYREQCSPGKPCQKMSTVVGYGWDPWKLDFFEPSKKAFAAAPWIFARGNHEDCHRAYLGYKILLSSMAWSKECEDFEDPQVIELGNLAIVNLDSSTISEIPETSSEVQSLWKKRLDALGEKLNNIKAQRIWLVTHKPIYGVVPLGPAWAPVNINLRKFFDDQPWSKRVELIFSGHVHNSQIVKTKANALQIVLGNGGTALDKSKGEISKENISSLSYEQAKVVQHDFGYGLIKDVDKANPTIEFHDSSGAKVFSCHVASQGKDCF